METFDDEKLREKSLGFAVKIAGCDNEQRCNAVANENPETE